MRLRQALKFIFAPDDSHTVLKRATTIELSPDEPMEFKVPCLEQYSPCTLFFRSEQNLGGLVEVEVSLEEGAHKWDPGQCTKHAHPSKVMVRTPPNEPQFAQKFIYLRLTADSEVALRVAPKFFDMHSFQEKLRRLQRQNEKEEQEELLLMEQMARARIQELEENPRVATPRDQRFIDFNKQNLHRQRPHSSNQSSRAAEARFRKEQLDQRQATLHKFGLVKWDYYRKKQQELIVFKQKSESLKRVQALIQLLTGLKRLKSRLERQKQEKEAAWRLSEFLRAWSVK